MKSDPTLRKWYNHYNRLYFGGELPAVDIVWGQKPRNYLAIARPMTLLHPKKPNKDYYLICVNPTLRKMKWWGVIRQTILHEMCHIATKCRDNHGPAWSKHMKRLALAGAFDKTCPKDSPIW